MGTAVGTDIVPVDRIDALVRTGGTRFLNRWFTPLEVQYCMAKSEPSRHLAARLAAKEAVVKALPPWDGPLPWRSIEIVRTPWGAPTIRLHGAFGAAAAMADIRDIQISLSHCDSYATAVAITGSDRSHGRA